MISIKSGKLCIPENERFIGFAGDNLHSKKQFLVENITDENCIYRLYLKFDDGSVNYFVLDSKVENSSTTLYWDILEEHIFKSGIVEAQIKSISDDGGTYHTTWDYFFVGNSAEFSGEFKNNENSEFLKYEKVLNEIYTKINDTDLDSYVSKNRSIAGIDLSADISAKQLQSALRTYPLKIFASAPTTSVSGQFGQFGAVISYEGSTQVYSVQQLYLCCNCDDDNKVYKWALINNSSISDAQLADILADYLAKHPITGEDGKDGASAYEIAVDNGFDGTEAEWLLSLHGENGTILTTYSENDSVATQDNGIDPDNPLWSQWNSRLSFGMDTSTAPVPFKVNGQLFADGTIIAHNNQGKNRNRWGYHIFEGYSTDNYSRMTMVVDKHHNEASSKPSLELYYYTGSNHNGSSYGNTKIGSDVEYHSFCFDRDKLTAYGEIDAQMPITLARISLANDIDSTFSTVEQADNAYEAETEPELNNKCLKYLALKNAENGAMFYDTDRNMVVCKIKSKWCKLPFEVITDSDYSVINSEFISEWELGVINPDGSNVDHTGRLRTVSYIHKDVTTITASDGYEFAIVGYDDNGNVSTDNQKGYWKFSENRFAGSVEFVSFCDLSSLDFGDYHNIRIILRRTDLADISVNESSAVSLS